MVLHAHALCAASIALRRKDRRFETPQLHLFYSTISDIFEIERKTADSHVFPSPQSTLGDFFLQVTFQEKEVESGILPGVCVSGYFDRGRRNVSLKPFRVPHVPCSRRSLIRACVPFLSFPFLFLPKRGVIHDVVFFGHFGS